MELYEMSYLPVTDAWTKLFKLPDKIAERNKINSIIEPKVAFKTAPIANEVWAERLNKNVLTRSNKRRNETYLPSKSQTNVIRKWDDR